VATARDRIQRAGALNVTLRHALVRDFVERDGFDLAIGRYVLVFQAAPAEFKWMASTFREVPPRALEFGLITAGEIAVEELEARVHAAVFEACAQIVGPDQHCAWTRV
jgi:hypothetical protein